MSKTFYCPDNQTLASNNVTPNSVTACTTNGEYITNEMWNQMKNILIQIHNFGERDTIDEDPTKPDKTKWSPDVSSINNITKNNNDFITIEDYKLLLDIVDKNPPNNTKNIGVYYQDLVDAVNDFKIPTTRYYCDAQGCEDACQSDAPYCPACFTGVCPTTALGGGTCTTCDKAQS